MRRYNRHNTVDEAAAALSKQLESQKRGLYCVCGDRVRNGTMLDHYRIAHPGFAKQFNKETP